MPVLFLPFSCHLPDLSSHKQDAKWPIKELDLYSPEHLSPQALPAYPAHSFPFESLQLPQKDFFS